MTDEQMAFLVKVFVGRIYLGVLGVVAIMLSPLRYVAFWAFLVSLLQLGIFLGLGFGVEPSTDPALHDASASGVAAGRLIGFSLFGVAVAAVAYGLKRLVLWPMTGSRFYIEKRIDLVELHEALSQPEEPTA